MSIKKLILTTIILLITITSCGPTVNIMPTRELGISLPSTKDVSDDEPSILESTPLPDPDLVTPTASFQSIRFQCLQILPSNPGTLRVSGQIILRAYEQNGSLFAMDILNGYTTEILSISGPHTIASVSPDQNLLAYRDNGSAGNGDNLIIVNAQLMVQKSIPWQSSWLTVASWINNSQLALQNLDPETMMVILDWTTSQEYPVSFGQLPDFSVSVRHPWIEFDPTMQRVLYPIIGDKYSLFDIKTEKSIAKLSSWTTETPVASWTQDGGVIAVIGPSPKYYDNLGGSDEIFAISRNGQVEQMTYLADYYGRGLGLYSPRWSPDGKQLAFWVQHEANGTLDHVLAIVDTTTKTATNFCISSGPSGYGGKFDESLPAPIWSPDGKQIIVENRFSDEHNRVVLVDLSNMIAVQISKDARPIGWMVTEPY